MKEKIKRSENFILSSIALAIISTNFTMHLGIIIAAVLLVIGVFLLYKEYKE
jgi:hypothetical protein